MTEIEAQTEAPGTEAEFSEQEEVESAIEKDLAETRDRLLRLQAEFDNYRKRMDRERIEIRRRAAEDLVHGLLPVLDHFEMGLQSLRDSFPEDPHCDGIELVFRQLLQALQQAGLQEVNAEGCVFDPNLHEAVGNLPSPDLEEGVVAQQVRKGYQLNNHLLRPASVLVACPAPAAEPEQE